MGKILIRCEVGQAISSDTDSGGRGGGSDTGLVRVDGFSRSGQAGAILCFAVVQADGEMIRQHQQ